VNDLQKSSINSARYLWFFLEGVTPDIDRFNLKLSSDDENPPTCLIAFIFLK